MHIVYISKFTYLKIPSAYRGGASKKRCFSELKGSDPCLFFKHGDKMAGLFKADLFSNGLDLHSRLGLQKLFCFGYSVICQIFIHGAADKAPKESGKILRGHINLIAQFLHGQS